MKSRTSFCAEVVVILLFGAWSFQACEKKEGPVTPDSGLESLSDPAVKPRVIATTPANGTTGPFSTYAPGPNSDEPHFIVQFNKYMNVASFNDARITCDGFTYPVRVVVMEDYSWYWRVHDGVPVSPTSSSGKASPFRELIGFQIVRSTGYQIVSYDIGKSYTITINSTVTDINGNELSNAYSFSFTPEPSFRATGTSPENGSEEGNLYFSSAAVYFNSPITSGILSSIHVTPSVGSSWSLGLYDSVSAIIPSVSQGSTWDFAKTYQITIDAGAADARGNILTSAFASTFSTAPFRVEYTDPVDGSAMNYLSGSAYITFNAPLDTSTIRSSITVSPLLGSGMVYEFYYGSDYVRLRALLGFNGGKTYSVTIAPTLKAKNGTPFPSPFVFYFATSPFRVQYTNPSNGADKVDRFWPIQIETNGLISQNNLASSISISPPVSLQWTTNGTSTYCSSYGTLAAFTTYTVTVSSGFRSIAGDSLAAPYSFTFTTGL